MLDHQISKFKDAGVWLDGSNVGILLHLFPILNFESLGVGADFRTQVYLCGFVDMITSDSM